MPFILLSQETLLLLPSDMETFPIPNGNVSNQSVNAVKACFLAGPYAEFDVDLKI
jgi:hypothetical protein